MNPSDEKALEVRVRELEKRVSRFEARSVKINMTIDPQKLTKACESGLSELTNHKND